MAKPTSPCQRRNTDAVPGNRPATLVIVPEEREYEPQVLAIQPSGFEAVASALVTVGLRFAAKGDPQETGRPAHPEEGA